MFTKMMMTDEVREILHGWADDFMSPSVKTAENEELAGFLRSMTAIGSITGSDVNTDALLWLRSFAHRKTVTINDPHIKKLPAALRENAKAIAKEATVVIDWLDKHGVKNG